MQASKVFCAERKLPTLAYVVFLGSCLCGICKAEYYISDGNLVREYLLGEELNTVDVNPVRVVSTSDSKYIYLIQNGPSTPTLSIYGGNDKESISTMIAVENRPSSIDLNKIKPTKSGVNIGRQIAEFIPSPFPDGNWEFQATALQLLVLATIEPDGLDSVLNKEYYNLKCLIEKGYKKSDLVLEKNAETKLAYDIKATDKYAKKHVL